MTTLVRPLAALILATTSMAAYAAPSVYPTGTTIYDPAKTWNGYTVLSSLSAQAVIVIDMNGNVVKRWDDYNDSAGGPARILPGGVAVAASGARPGIRSRLSSCNATSTARSCGSSIATRRSKPATARRCGRFASITTGSATTFRPATTRPRPSPRSREQRR